MDATIIPPRTDIRGDLRRIADMVGAGARVLDVGCGDGALLDLLTREKGVDGRGMELGMDGVRACVSRGLSVIQGDADIDLKDYPSDAFDFVILSQTLQATRDPRGVLLEMLRIGRRVIVSFPNFGYWRVRLALLLTGRMPVTDRLGFQWWETPNIHFCTIADFTALCADLGIMVERSAILDHTGHQLTSDATTWRANWSGEQGVFLLRRD
ncbi:MAG: methionine biosynthesis protein MetW [Azospirillaceae bacterium]|nr:methionine biosynthesis protein MetW [Azospirillaceae bacterium]